MDQNVQTVVNKERAYEAQDRYVALANQIAELSKEAADLEVVMSENNFTPMSLNVYDSLKKAHEAIRAPPLMTLAAITGRSVDFEQPQHSSVHFNKGSQ